MENRITKEKLEKYFLVTEKAYSIAKKSIKKKDYDMEDRINSKKEIEKMFLDMPKRYISDAKWFYKKNDFVNAFAALNYAHGWLDAGASSGIFDVNDSELFTVD